MIYVPARLYFQRNQLGEYLCNTVYGVDMECNYIGNGLILFLSYPDC